mmetsp:Transcript_62764/g.135951  ORF Transcript_62764/g.135951 Transcript_62764/m.135951 type:complete len:89 (+) Transcript_62764:214-480(+)
MAKTDGTSKKMDVKFHQLNCEIWDDRWEQVETVVNALLELEKDARDWEAKNKLKVYKALLDIRQRKFQAAADALLNAINSFQDLPVLD